MALRIDSTNTQMTNPGMDATYQSENTVAFDTLTSVGGVSDLKGLNVQTLEAKRIKEVQRNNNKY